MNIYYVLHWSWLGLSLIARSERGLVAVMLGDTPEQLHHEIGSRFSQAQEVNIEFDSELKLAAHAVDNLDTLAPITFDLQGSEFQIRVWQALQDIPPGTTCSYSALARNIGNAKAVRAVASACGANPIAVLIPCHRVLRQDGTLSGYRWGVERKKALLRREQESRVLGAATGATLN